MKVRLLIVVIGAGAVLCAAAAAAWWPRPGLAQSLLLVPPTVAGLVISALPAALYPRRAVRMPRAFTVWELTAFAALPDLSGLRVVGWILVTVFWDGSTAGAIRVFDSSASVWRHASEATIAAIGLAVTVTAVLHAVHAWRGAPRPCLSITHAGLTHHGLAGSVHVPWGSLKREYAIQPDRTAMMLDLPVYDRGKVRVRGLRPGGVRLPRLPYRYLRFPTLWRTHPWWAGQAIAWYHDHSCERSQIGTVAEHERLKRRLRSYDDEIQLP
jgi:hypothetical protein